MCTGSIYKSLMGLTTNCETAKTFKPVESKPVQLLTGSRKKVNRKNFTLN